MPRLLPILLVLSGLALPPALAQDTSSAAEKTPTVRRATAAPTPVPKKPNFFQRLFGRRPTPPPATPVPAPTPKPRKPRSTSRPTSSKPASTTAKTKAPAATAKPTASADKPTEPTDQPAPATPAPKPVAKKPTPKPATTKTGKTKTPLPPPPDGSDADVIEKHKYDAVKAKAMEDPEVKGLKAKADDAVTDDEANRAQKAYNRALFAKMRKLEPSIKERIDRMESALMRRLGDQPR